MNAEYIEMLEKLRAVSDRLTAAELDMAAHKLSLEMTKQRLVAYQKAINKIDDWFEYANESVSDRERVHEILDKLTEELTASCSPKTLN